MPIKRLFAVIALSAALLWAVSLINHTVQASPALRPLANPPWNSNTRVSDAALSPTTIARDEPALASSQTSADVFAVWRDERNGDGDIYFAHSTNDGQTWGASIRVNHDSAGAEQSAPDIARDLSGTLHVAWVDDRETRAIYYARSTDDGQTWSKEIRVNDSVIYIADSPAIAVRGEAVSIAWHGGFGDNIYINSSVDGGLTWGADDWVDGGLHPDIALDGYGRMHVVWDDIRSYDRNIYYAYKAGSAWSVSAKLNHDLVGTSVQEKPALAVINRSVYVVWQDYRSGTQIYANYSADSGDTWQSTDRRVSDGGTVSDAPALAATSSGVVWAVWRIVSGTQHILYADQGGTSWGTDAIVIADTRPLQQPALSAGNSRVHAAWSKTSSDIFLSYFDAVWHTPVQVNDEGEARQEQPSLAMGSSGNLYAAWLDYRTDAANANLYAARSTDGGQTWSANTRVSAPATPTVGTPALAASGDLTVHAAWQTYSGTTWSIYYDRSTDGGLTWGSDQVLAQKGYMDGGAFAPDAATNGSNVYVVWDASISGYPPNILLRRSTTNGTSWLAETRIVTPSTAGTVVRNPTLAVDLTGTLHLAWEEPYAYGAASWGVCYARSTNLGVAWTNRQCISQPPVTTTHQINPDLAVDPVNGRVHIVWQDDRAADGLAAVYQVSSSNNGVTWGTPIKISGSYGPSVKPAIAAVDSGIVYAIWQDARNDDGDIYYSRSTNGGVTWNTQQGRVNDDDMALFQPQFAPAMAVNYAASHNNVYAAWSDFRRSTWDVYATSLITSCSVPLSSMRIQGSLAITPNIPLTLSLQYAPSNATLPVSYTWLPRPEGAPDAAQARYMWAYPGQYEVAATSSNCGGPVGDAVTVTVMCTAPITRVRISGPVSVIAREPVTLTAMVLPGNANPPITYTWSPTPVSGQGSVQAVYNWIDVGSHTVSFTATNCGGAITDGHAIAVIDNDPPTWTFLSPTDWSLSQSPEVFMRAQDPASGLDVSTAQYALSTNSGGNWTGWLPADSGSSGDGLPLITVKTTAAFGQDSGTTHLNRIKFRINDMAGNLSASPTYAIDVDTTPPTTPTLVTADRPVWSWSNNPTIVITWTGAADTSSGIAGYSAQWAPAPNYYPNAPITSSNRLVYTLTQEGQWYFHVRTVDNAGWSSGTVDQGPYQLDTIPPDAPVIAYSEPVTGEWTNDNVIDVYWNMPAAAARVVGWSYDWSTSSTTDPDTTMDSPELVGPTLFKAASPALLNSSNHYFHIRALDMAGNWGPATHYGPFKVDTTPPVLIAYNESGAPGSDVLLTGLVFPADVSVTLYFTESNGYKHTLGSFQTSVEGTFQVLATVPLNTPQGPHRFIAQIGAKSASAAFNVTPGMSLSAQPAIVKMGFYGSKSITVTLGQLNPNGAVVIETDLNKFVGPLTLNGATSLIKPVSIPYSAISGTHTLTATTRIAGMVVQRAALTYTVQHAPPPQITTPQSMELSVSHGPRGTVINVTGRNSWADLDCGQLFGEKTIYSLYNPDHECVFVKYDLEWLTGDHHWTKDEWNESDTFETDAYGFFTGQAQVYDGWSNAWPNGPLWDVGQEMPWGQYNVCLVAHMWTLIGDVSDWSKEIAIDCLPFTVDPPPTPFTAQYALKDKNANQFITLNNAPQIIVAGKQVGYVNDSPIDTQATFSTTIANTPITVSLPEGSYQFIAFACKYEPRSGLFMRGRGSGGETPIELTPTTFTGPGVFGVSANRTTYLAAQNKIGPFLSFVGPNGVLLPGAPSAPVTFIVDVPVSPIASVSQVSVTIAGVQKAATKQGGLWKVAWNMSEIPAGEIKMNVRAFGHYLTSGECGQGDAWGPIYEKVIVMAPAPPWLYNDTWVSVSAPDLAYNSATGRYSLLGKLKGSVNETNDTDLSFLGSMKNGVTAEIVVTHTFDVVSGIWMAGARVDGGADVLCYTDPFGEKHGGCGKPYQVLLRAIPVPPRGPVDSTAVPAFPDRYTAPTQNLLSASVGPIEVYNGLLASYWGIVNVYLSVNFGAEAALDITPGLQADFTPEITLTPSATINGTISLWVDVLAGVASAGVDAIPSLTLSMPIHIAPPETTVEGPIVCFRMQGRVWAEMLWWDASFGPFDLLSLGDCNLIKLSAQAATPPPSTLPAPALATDGYGHVLGAWVHDTSNHPQQNQGALYSVYFNGASWGAQTPVVDNSSILVTDPAIAFAGYGKAVAVFAANSPNATQPVTWSQVSQQLTTQGISYTVWNTNTWSAPAKLASGGGDPRGRVALAGDPYHNRVLAAWVRDQSPDDTLKYWTLEYSWFNANTNTWSPVKALSTPMIGETDAEVSLAFDSTGKATAVWVRQGGVQSTPAGDSPFNNNDLRHLVVATWNPNTDVWTTDEHPDGMPTGVLMPSVALDDQDRPMLAYALYLHDRDGVSNTGFGNNNYLGYAVKPSSGAWEAHTVLSVRGVERPRVVMLPEQQAAIVYRGFGEPGTIEYSGVAMAAVVDLRSVGNRADASQAITAGPLTGGNSWMHDAVALNPTQSGTGSVQPSLITLGVYNLGGPAAKARAAGANLRDVSLPGDDVLATHIPVLPDLSVAVQDIVITQTLPLSGTLVPISVTVRNLGLARTHQAVIVRLIVDADTVEEQELMSGTIPIGLMFNGTSQLAGAWRATSGYHRLTVRVSPPIDDDVDGTNNEATILIGVPATPTDLDGSVNAHNQSLGLAWQPVSGPALSHYRVYRAEGAGALTKLRETTEIWVQDKAILPGVAYRYAVSAVSDAGVESPLSDEITLGTRALYLPLIRR